MAHDLWGPHSIFCPGAPEFLVTPLSDLWRGHDPASILDVLATRFQLILLCTDLYTTLLYSTILFGTVLFLQFSKVQYSLVQY